MEFRSLGHGTWQLAPSSLANEFRPEIRTLLTWARVVEYEFQNRTPNKKRYSFNEKVRGFHGCIYTYYIIIYIIYIYTSYLYIYIYHHTGILGLAIRGYSVVRCGWERFHYICGSLVAFVLMARLESWASWSQQCLDLTVWISHIGSKSMPKKKRISFMFFKFCRCVQTLTRRQMFNRCSQLRHRRAYFLWQRLRCSIQTCWVVTAMKGNFT